MTTSSNVENLQPDLILLDIGLPGTSGIEAARRIRKVSPKSRILFLSQHDSLHMAMETMKTGARTVTLLRSMRHATF
jgi:DNA-binding NarL/FixJ family response regulator